MNDTEVIDVDSDEDASSDDHDDEPIDLPDIPTSGSKIRFSSPQPVVIEKRHDKKASRAPLSDHEETGSDPESPAGLRELRKSPEWKAVYELAQNSLFAYILFKEGFPSPDDLFAEASECYDHAVIDYNVLNRGKLVNRREARARRDSIISLLMDQVAYHQGKLKDYAQRTVKRYLDMEEKRTPRTPTIICSHPDTGDPVEVKEGHKAALSRIVRRLQKDHHFLDDYWTIPGKTTSEAVIRLNSPLLRVMVPHVFDSPAWQPAILASPCKADVDRSQIRLPWNPSLHWTEGTPPRLVAFVGTIISVCLEEWAEGKLHPIALHQPSNHHTYQQLLEYIEKHWTREDLVGRMVRSHFHSWASISSLGTHVTDGA